jgi:hypothetical protein
MRDLPVSTCHQSYDFILDEKFSFGLMDFPRKTIALWKLNKDNKLILGFLC